MLARSGGVAGRRSIQSGVMHVSGANGLMRVDRVCFFAHVSTKERQRAQDVEKQAAAVAYREGASPESLRLRQGD